MSDSIKQSFRFRSPWIETIKITMRNFGCSFEDVDQKEEDGEFVAAIWHCSLLIIDRHSTITDSTVVAAHDPILTTTVQKKVFNVS